MPLLSPIKVEIQASAFNIVNSELMFVIMARIAGHEFAK